MSHARRTLGVVLILAVFCLALWLPSADQPARSLQAAQRQPSGNPSLPQKQEPGSQDAQIVAGEVVTPSLSPVLADLPLYQPEYRLDREINPRLSYNSPLDPNFNPPGGPDPLLAVQEAAQPAAPNAFGTPILNFNGQGYTGVNPPDTVGDVGPNHYVQMINGSGGGILTVYNKTTGAVISGPTSLDSLGAGACASGIGDPIVLYDQAADRWLLSEFASGGNHLCVYVSQTASPTGAYYAYDFTTPVFPDYPKYGVWPDAYYVSTNETTPTVYALDRAKMLAGLAATSQRATAPGLAGFAFEALTPADLDGATAPPANSPGLFMRHVDTEAHAVGGYPTQDILEVWRFQIDWTTPGNSSFAKLADILVSEFDSTLCGLTSFYCMAMPGVAQGSTSSLDPLREVVMNRLAYRNFGDHETLVGNFVTDVNGADRGGVRWFELRKSGAGAWSLYQEGTYSPSADNRWMGAIAMDSAGNIALGYNVSSGTVSPSLRYTGRLASDTLGTMTQGDNVLVNGTATNGSNRYGDYAAMSVDPSDDCTFWFTGQWNGASTWSTRIGKFKFDQCGTPDFTISATPASQEICAGANAQYNVAIGSISGYASPVTLSASGNPGSAGFSPNPVTPPGNSTLTLSGAAPGTYNFNVVGTAAGPNVHQTSVGLTVQAAAPAAPVLTAPADASTGVSVLPTFTWGAVAQAVSYDIQVASDPAFVTIVASATGLTGTSYTPATPLMPATAYYWRVRANNICGTSSYSALAAFMTANLAIASFCRSPNLAIPDNNTTGVTDSQVVATAATLTDLNVSVRSTHTWVGDLIFTVTNVGSATSVTIIDRPGVPATAAGCSNNHINATLDDGAGSPVETQCAISGGTTPPPYAIDGTFTPNNPLTAFNGQALNATWQINASDRAGADLGTLNDWCLIATYGGPFSADLSDLASGYGVAWHTGGGALRLGPGWTADTSFAAGADDATDDGVAFITSLQPGQPATVRVNVTGTPVNGRWLRLWLDWDGNGVFDTTEKAYDGAAVNGNNDLTVAVPLGQTNTAKYRVRLYDSASSPAAAEAIDTGSYGGATGGEVEDGTSPAPLAVTLASFAAQGETDRVVVTWETVSELDNAGFNLYRSDNATGPQTLLATIPSQAPGSAQGFAYSYDDLNVEPGQTWWYWLEDISFSGATTLHGPVSATVNAPTAVTLASLQAVPASPAIPAAEAALAGLAGLVAAMGVAVRRRRA